MKTKLKLQVKRIFIMLFAISSIGLWAQTNDKENNSNNEIKINMGSLLFELPEVSYEHIINEESSFGISVAFPIDKNKSVSYGFIVYPNYRIYFSNKRAAGFFFEGNSAIFSQRFQKDGFPERADKNKIGFGLGIAIGGKFLTKSGFIGEIYIGGGRNFVNTDIIDSGYPRAGISIGKRF